MNTYIVYAKKPAGNLYVAIESAESSSEAIKSFMENKFSTIIKNKGFEDLDEKDLIAHLVQGVNL